MNKDGLRPIHGDLVICKPCPCGCIPHKLYIVQNGQGTKYASAYCDKCGEWSIEFKTQYNALDSKECMELAIHNWNNAPRV